MLKTVTSMLIAGSRVQTGLKSFLKDRAGVTAIEYGLIAALIAVAVIATVTTVGTNLGTTFTTIANKL